MALRSDYECFRVGIEDKVATITLSRPDAYNAMSRAFWNELPEIVNVLSGDALARCIVIESEGKHFSSGMDVSVFTEAGVAHGGGADRYVQAEEFIHHVRMLQDSFSCLERARMPVLVACQGGVIGGAVDLVTACDVRYAVKDAFFQIQETNIGMTADVGTFPRLCKLMPEGAVRELAYTGRRLGAERAFALGLVTELYETQEAMRAGVQATAREIAAKSPLAVSGCKRMINYARDHTTGDTLDFVGAWNSGMLAGEHIMEAFAARMEKREPHFPDLLPVRKKM